MKKYENLAKAVYDVGKYTFTALVIGQFIKDTFDFYVMVGGSVFTLLIFWLATTIEKIKER